MYRQFAVERVDVHLPLLGQQTLEMIDRGTTERGSVSTILIGRNGTGKSTILREIVMACRSYFSADKLRSRQGRDRVAKIDILANGQSASLDLMSSAKVFSSEREAMGGRDLRPSRLIALSFTPFDKFPPADDSYRFGREERVDPFYVYLGFKTDYRSISPRARLLRSIDRFAFGHPDQLADQRVADVLDIIGYGTRFSIVYEIDRNRFEKLRERERPVPAEEILEILARHGLDVGPRSRRQLTYDIDFGTGFRQWSVPMSPEEARVLSGASVLRLTAITLDRRDGEPIDLLELSSGELNLLSGFLGLAAFLDDGCLVLIDEPENSLHPEWQIRYSDMLEAVLKRYSGCHYIIATHSPLIVSGVADGRTSVLRLDQMPIAMPSEVVSGASPDATLLNAFRVVTSGNNFLKQLVSELFGLVELGEHKGQRGREIASLLSNVYERIPDRDPVRPIVAGLVELVLA